MPADDTHVTVWALIATTALSAAGWVTTTLRDRRTADSVVVTAATELVDRLTSEIARLDHEVESLRDDVARCEARHADLAARLAGS